MKIDTWKNNKTKWIPSESDYSMLCKSKNPTKQDWTQSFVQLLAAVNFIYFLQFFFIIINNIQ